MSRRGKSLTGLGVIVLALGAATAAFLAGTAGAARTAAVVREDLEVIVEAPGKLEAEVAYEIGPPSVQDFWNYNLSWMIPEGSIVKAGDVVARFDSTDLDDRLRDHQTKLETVQQEKEKEERNLEVGLRQLRLDLVKAEGELKTVELDLSVPENLVSSIEWEQTKLKRQLARRRVEFLREKIVFDQELVKAKLELLDVKRAYEKGKVADIQTAKDKFNVPAPVQGLVVYMPKRNGDRWEIGERVWMLAKILKVADVTTLRVEANLLEVDASRIRPGQRAKITVDAIPGMVLESDIAEIGRLVRERSLQDRSKVFDAILPLQGVDPQQLRPGMGVQVEIRTQVLADQLTIPLDAVIRSDDGTYVEVVGSTGDIATRAVTLGARSGDRVAVQEGLAEGETVRLGGGRT